MKRVLVAINAKYTHTNLAVRYLKNALTGQGIPCEFVEYTINQPVREIVAGVAAFEPEQILFSCYLWNISYVCRVGGDLRRIFPNATILLGGPEVSFEPEMLLPSFPFADGILCGEGEVQIGPILTSSHIGGIYRPTRYVDLDDLPFPYGDELPKDRVIYYESSRGCPFGCAYCLSSADRVTRYRSISLVFQDLERMIKAQVMQVKFVDRTFNIDSERAITIWRFLIEHDNGYTSFQMEIGGDLLTNEMLDLFAKARPGLFQLEVGVQSTHRETLHQVCRDTDLDKLKAAMLHIHRHGHVHRHLDLIAGLPGESFQRFLQSFDEVFSLHPEQLQLGFLKLLRGSALYGRREALGLVHSSYPPYEILETPCISFAELTQLKKLEQIVEIYYNSGRFSYQLAFLLAQVSSPAETFLALADRLPDRAMGKYEAYDLLYEFISANITTNASLKKLSWLMRLDICLHERPRKLPIHCEVGMTAHFKNEIRTLGLDPSLHFEVFPFDFTKDGMPPETVAVTFDYQKRDPAGRASFQKIGL